MNSNKLSVVLNVVLSIGLVGIYYVHFSSQERIAYVDSAKLLSSYEGMIRAQQTYQEKVSVWQANIDSLTSEVQEALQNHQQEVAHLSDTEKQQAEQLLRRKQEQLANYQQAIREKANQENQRMTQEVITQINNYLSEYGDQKDYKVILVANETGTIAYAQQGMDVTGEVLQALNDGFSK